MVALVETKELDLKNLKGQKSEPTLFFHYFSFMLEWVKASIIFGSLVAQVNLLMHSSLESFFVTHTASQFMSSSLSVLILPSLFRLL